MISFSTLSRNLAGLFAAAALAVAVQAQNQERSYSPTDTTAEELPKIKAASDAKNFPEALKLIDAVLAKAAPDSYDAAILNQYKTQILLQMGEYSKAIEPIEKSLALSDAKSPTYFDERQTRELYFFLFQLYFQEANTTKNKTLVSTYYDKARKAIEHWLKISNESNADAQMYYAQLLLSQAMMDPAKPDRPLLEQAIKEIDKGLLLATRPKDTFYLLKLVALQQLERNAESAELLELVLKQKPDSANYWQQLAALYLSLGQDLRAIVTLERAQVNGFMNTPKDNYNLIGIYFNTAQYEKASELLEKHLRAGTIESDVKNWELLAHSYQQLQRPLKGIEALKEGAKAFPKSGQLEFLIGQAYASLDNQEQAMKHFEAATIKGGLQKPHQAYLALSYSAYQAQKFEVALKAAEKAAEFPEGAKDGGAMAKAIRDIIADREAKKNKA
jgi:tetratricopeptide (TPR) repeat protein